jgi:putrescine transport system substrate-binding protein
MWGSTGYAINVDLVKARMPDAPLGSAAMLFDPEIVARFADCGVSLLDEPTDVIPMVLQYLGHDPNSMKPEDIAEAEAQLKKVRPYVRYFSSARMLNDLPNREVCIAMSWSGDYAQAMARASEVGADVNLAYYVPREGALYWFDGAFIPVDAPHPGNAHLFLNYLLRPEVIGAISNETHYANANMLSFPFMLTEIANDPATYPPQEEKDRAVTGYLFGPKDERRRTRAWSRVKTGL